jgi:DNA-binding NarL/FixJ family response regulator
VISGRAGRPRGVAGEAGTPRVVIADDDEDYAASLATLLEADGRVEVIGIASTGDEAVQLALWHDPDIVLMDVAMPGIDGVQATRLVRESRPRLCILMMSGTESDELRVEAQKAGAAGFMHKSRVLDNLVDAILELADREGHGVRKD